MTYERKNDPRFDMDPSPQRAAFEAGKRQGEAKRSGFRGLPWLVRWAIYVFCLCIIVPPACTLLLVSVGIGAAVHEGYSDHVAKQQPRAKR